VGLLAEVLSKEAVVRHVSSNIENTLLSPELFFLVESFHVKFIASFFGLFLLLLLLLRLLLTLILGLFNLINFLIRKQKVVRSE
jgi:hypothetical protein